MQYLKIIRPLNLAIIATTQLIFWYFLLLPSFSASNVIPLLDNTKLTLLVTMTILISAAGYVINDIFDIEADHYNKGKDLIVSNSIPIRNAKVYFTILNVLAFGIAAYLVAISQEFNILVICAVTTLALYFYSKSLKSSILLGNILISLLIALVPFIFIFVESEAFEILKSKDPELYITTFLLIVAFTVFAFISNLIRELIKDCEDIKGDEKANITTIATAFGLKRVEKISVSLCIVLFLACLSWSIQNQIWISWLELIFFLVFILGSIIFIILNIMKDTQIKSKYLFISRSLKILMASGLFYLFLHLNTLYG